MTLSVLTVNTSADLVQILPNQGICVRTLGHISVGDGGGGLWCYADDGAATDGVACLAAVGDVSDEKSLAVSINSVGIATLETEMGSDVDWGSVELDFGSATVGSIHLHGHNFNADALEAGFDHASGQFSHSLLNSFIASSSRSGSTIVNAKWKNVENSRRWKRHDAIDASVLRADWWGDLALEDDGHHCVKWLVTSAKGVGGATVDLCDFTIPYLGNLTCVDGVTLRNGVFRVPNDKAYRTYLSAYAFDDPEFFTSDYEPWMRVDHSPTTPITIRLFDIEIDGNVQNNQNPFTNPQDYSVNVEDNLRNTPVWGALGFSNHNGIEVGDGSRIIVDNLDIHDCPSNTIVGHGHQWWEIGRIRLGNSAKGHLLYTVQGTIKNLEIWGYWWTAAVICECLHVDQWVCQEQLGNPYYTASPMSMFNIRGLQHGLSMNHQYRRTGTYFGRGYLSWDHPDYGVTIFSGVGNGVVIDSVHVQTWETGTTRRSVRLFSESGNGYQQSLQRGWFINNVNVEVRTPVPDEEAFVVTTQCEFVDYHLGNLQISVRDGAHGANNASVGYGEPLRVGSYGSGTRSDPAYLRQRRTSVENIVLYDEANTSALVRISDIKDDDAGVVRANVRNATWRVNGSPYFTGLGSSGLTTNLTNTDVSKVRITLEDVALETGPLYVVNWSSFFDLTERVRNLSLVSNSYPNGLCSEESGEVLYIATGGETHLTIPTNLIWVPRPDGSVAIKPKTAATAQALANHYVSWRDAGDTRDATYTFYPGVSVCTCAYTWAISANGTAEYYLLAQGGGNPGLDEVRLASYNGDNMIPGDLGGLSSGEFSWGDSDSLGFDTLYVRLPDDGNPAMKPLDSVKAQMWTQDNFSPQLRINFAAPLAANDHIQFLWAASLTR